MAESPLIESLASYISGALARELPAEVEEKTKHHMLDTLAAMATGAQLKPGKLAVAFARDQGGPPESTVVGSNVATTAINAALANGMLAHSDETDDSHAPSLTHPGCQIVPAALAVAEREGASGEALSAGRGAGVRRGEPHREGDGRHRSARRAWSRDARHRADVRRGGGGGGARGTR